MDSFQMLDKRKAIIKTTWEYLLRKGLANASVGDLCRETKLAQSSLYYWFENKDDIWISAGKYGLSTVVDKLFVFTLEHTKSLREYFDTLLREIDKYKDELRCVIQITVSPVFGERMRETMKEFNDSYADFAKQLMEIFDCAFDLAEIFIYTTLSAIIDYVVWEDGEKTQMLLDNLYQQMIKDLRAVETEKR